MPNYSGTIEEQKNKAKEYRKKYYARPEVQEQMKEYRTTKEYKKIAQKASRKFRQTEEYRAKARAYKQQQSYKDKRRDTLLKKQFGITLLDYNQMLVAQNSVCAICSQQEEVRSLAVDHCHTTGRIRGLLCRRCNVVIGLMEDSKSFLGKAIEYLDGV